MWKESFRESGNIREALIHLEEHEGDIFDKIQLLEMKGTYNLILENFSAAEKIYEELLRRNLECGQYYEHLVIAKQLSQECFTGYNIALSSHHTNYNNIQSDQSPGYPLM